MALHEAGHTIAANELCLLIVEISTISVADVGDRVNTRPDDELLTRVKRERLGIMMLGGRAEHQKKRSIQILTDRRCLWQG
ncbi:hypothetical protein [Devosia sp. A449]